jgi:hypothetical protein
MFRILELFKTFDWECFELLNYLKLCPGVFENELFSLWSCVWENVSDTWTIQNIWLRMFWIIELFETLSMCVWKWTIQSLIMCVGECFGYLNYSKHLIECNTECFELFKTFVLVCLKLDYSKSLIMCVKECFGYLNYSNHLIECITECFE